jgi:hypothetical protein
MSVVASGKTVPVGTTGYRLDTPDNYLVSTPQGTTILLEVKSPADDIAIQVMPGAKGSTADAMATDYEGRIRAAFTSFVQSHESRLTVAGEQTLYRRYNAAANQQKVTVQTLYFVRGDDRFVLHAVTLPGKEDAALAILQSFHVPAPPSATPKTATLPLTQATLTLPATWTIQANPQTGAMQFALPNQTGLMEVLETKLDPSDMTPAQLVELMLGEVVKEIAADPPGLAKTDEKNLSRAGITATYRSFTGNMNGQGIDLVLAVYHADDALVTLYGLFNSVSRADYQAEVEQVAATFTLPNSIPATPTANANMQRIAPTGWGITFEAPADWRRKSTSASESFTGAAGSPAEKASLTVQKFSRREAAHRDLAASLNTTLAQVRRMPTANVLRKDTLTVGAFAASLVEISYPVQEKPHRMMQVIVATDTDVYWLNFAAPQEVYHQQVALFEQTVASLTTGQTPAAGAAATTFTTGAGGVSFDVPAGWTQANQQGAVVFSPPAGSPFGQTTIRVTVLPRGNAESESLRKAVNTCLTTLPKATTVRTMVDKTYGGMLAHLIEGGYAPTDDEAHNFWYIHVERPNIIIRIHVDLYDTLHKRMALREKVVPVIDALTASLHAR